MQPHVLHDGLNDKQVRALRAFWTSLTKTAPPRFRSYVREGEDRDGFDPLARYLWNIALGEALLPTLNGAELMLKNVIHNAMVDETQNPWWFKSTGFLEESEVILLRRASDEAENKKRGKSHYVAPTADDVVAELSFRFWTGLLDSDYEKKVWSVILRNRLPNLDDDLKERHRFRAEFNKIRELRNRVAHNEPIFHLRALALTHASACRMVGVVNAAYGKILRVIDRFDDVVNAGSGHYRNVLLQAFDHAPATAFKVEPKKGDGRWDYELIGVSVQACAAVFDCQELAEWLGRIANAHPTQETALRAWQAWLDERQA